MAVSFDPNAEDRARYAAVMRRAADAGPIANSGTFAWVMKPIASPQRIEIAWLAHLDDGGHMRRVTELERGGVDSVAVCYSATCADVATTALDGGERYVILCHNHPAGWAWPSDADADLFRRVGAAMQRRGLQLLDSVILGHDQHYSFTERQLWESR